MYDQNSYSQGYSDGESAKANYAFGATFIGIILTILNLIILFTPAILITYLILDKLRWLTYALGKWEYFFLFIAIMYIVESAAFFLKGWLISLKSQTHKLWIALLVLLSVYCLIFPTLFFHVMIVGTFIHPTKRLAAEGNIPIWIISALIGLYVFYRYSLTKPGAPMLFRWSYQLGLKL